MSERNPLSDVQVDVNAGRLSHAATPSDDMPFHIAVMGNFSGRAEGARPDEIARRPVLRVDRDDLDAAIARLAPALTLDIGATEPLRISFTSLQDFHPDSLYGRLPIFTALRELRAGLTDPRSAATTAARLHADRGDTPSGTSPGSDTAATAARLAGGSLLDDIVDATNDNPAPARGGRTGKGDGSDLDRFLRDIVSPHLVPGPDPRMQELLTSVDAATTSLLRSILGHPDFRALEALWRGLDLLVRRVETGSSLRLAIVDIAGRELVQAVAPHPAGGDHRPLADLLAAGARIFPESAPWSLLVALGAPVDGETGVMTLAGLAAVAAALGAPALAAAPTAIVEGAVAGGEAVSRWEALRHSTEGQWLGVAHPSVLLRLPYGEDGDPCDDIHFEELEPGSSLERARAALPWGDPALIPAIVLAAAFAADGWRMDPRGGAEVDRLPLHLHRGGSGVDSMSPARRMLDEDDVDALLDLGVMPLTTVRDQDTVVIVRIQSVGRPSRTLSGRWQTASR